MALLTTGEVRRHAATLVTNELVVVPVRHHSPACALHLRQLIAATSPCVVLVEGPRSFTPLVDLLTHAEARMPLAIYTYAVRGDDRRAAYYPFADHSPETVALREARARGIPARFIDLDFAEQAALGDADDGLSLLHEKHFEHSARLTALAARLGCHDEEDLWEHLFEADADAVPAEEHLARLTAYCLLARQDHDLAQLDADGTTAREAEMAWHVREALDARAPGDGPVLAVVGGFHGVVLPTLVAERPARPGIAVGKGESGSALIRYSFDRLDRLNGYSAGMTSPGWHQRLWERRQDGAPGTAARTETALTTLFDIAIELRKRVPVPTPSLAAAYEHLLRLAELRGHVAPLRSDLVDAVTSCFVKGEADGDGALVRAVTRAVLCGADVGIVPPGAGTPPLVHDTLARLRAQKLHTDDIELRTTNLDIYRSAQHRTTSRLLHGLAYLAVPFARRVAGPDFVTGVGLGRLQERWEYVWSPATEGVLVECSVLGSSLPEAVATKFSSALKAFREGGDRRDARVAASWLTRACVLGLHDQATEALAAVRRALGDDIAFDGVTAAAVHLAVLWEGREPLEARHLTELPALLRTAYERAIYLGRELRGAETEPEGAVRALTQLRELLAGGAGESLDPEPYWAMVTSLSTGHDVALVRGGATGLLYAAGELGARDLARAVTGHLGGTVPPPEAVGFCRGLLLTAREAAWQQGELVEGLDGRLAGWDDETFLAHLPDLRLAFAGMTPAETDRVATSVARLHGLGDLGPLLHRDLDEASMTHHLAVSEAVAGMLRRHGLGEWVEAR